VIPGDGTNAAPPACCATHPAPQTSSVPATPATSFGEPRSDATARAVRLWLLRDRQR